MLKGKVEKMFFVEQGRELLRHYLNHAKLLVMPGEEKGSDVLPIVSFAVIMQLYQLPGSLLAAIY